MKELLDSELFSHPLLRDGREDPFLSQLKQTLFEHQKTISPYTDMSIDFYETYRPDRSSIYAQVLCNLFVDRTCSRGLSRRVSQLSFDIEDVAYDAVYWLMPAKMRPKVSVAAFPPAGIDYTLYLDQLASAAPFLRMSLITRKYLADFLALPLADFRDFRVWPDPRGHATIEITIDSGIFVDELSTALNSSLNSNELNEVVGHALSNWRSTLPTTLAQVLDVVSQHILEEGGTKMRRQLQQQQQNAYGAGNDGKSGNSPTASNRPPAMRISNVKLRTRLLDPIRGASSLAANYSGGDPLEANEGTFDLGEIDGHKPSCSTRFLTEKITFSTYAIVTQAGTSTVRGQPGEQLEIFCRSGLLPASPSSGVIALSPQLIVCAGGRWLAVGREPLLTCHKPCPPFQLEPLREKFMRVVGSGEAEGSIRLISCATGYQDATAGGLASEEVKCQKGQWTEPTLQCRRAPLFDGTCSGVPLDLLVTEFFFRMATQFTSTNVQWWSAQCTRGYERAAGAEPLQMVCLDNSVLYVFAQVPDNLADLLKKPSERPDKVEALLRQMLADRFEVGESAKVDLARLMWSSSLPIKPDTAMERLQLICTEATLPEPQLLVDHGIDDWTYIGIVAGIALGVTSGFAAWGYYWQVRGRAKRNLRRARKAAAAAAAAAGTLHADDDDDNDDDEEVLKHHLLGPKEAGGGRFPSTQDTDVLGGGGGPLPSADASEEFYQRHDGDQTDYLIESSASDAWERAQRQQAIQQQLLQQQQQLAQQQEQRQKLEKIEAEPSPRPVAIESGGPSQGSRQKSPAELAALLAMRSSRHLGPSETTHIIVDNGASSNKSFYSDIEYFTHQRNSEDGAASGAPPAAGGQEQLAEIRVKERVVPPRRQSVTSRPGTFSRISPASETEHPPSGGPMSERPPSN